MVDAIIKTVRCPAGAIHLGFPFPAAGVGQEGPADITDLMVEETAQQEDDEQDEQVEIDDFDD